MVGVFGLSHSRDADVLLLEITHMVGVFSLSQTTSSTSSENYAYIMKELLTEVWLREWFKILPVFKSGFSSL